MNGQRWLPALLFATAALCGASPSLGQELGEHGFVDSGGVKLHYVTAGEGPLVVMIHGLKDVALLPGALNDTWLWIDNEFTLVTLPDAGHFVQHDAADLVAGRVVRWLTE